MGLLPITTILVIFVVIVCYVDIKYLTIYNSLTIPFCLLGIGINILMSGMNGLLTSILGLLTGLLLILLPFLRGWVGGGDVKFLAAIGALVGPKIIAYSTLWGFVLFGIASIIYLLIKGRFKMFLHTFLSFLLIRQNLVTLSCLEVSGKLPLGVFLGVSILLNWLYFTGYLMGRGGG